MLKKRNICRTSEHDERELYAYGQTEPLKTLNKGRSKVKCNITNVSSEEEFVIKGEAKALMGWSTAERLGVLRVGPKESVNVVSGNDDVSRFGNVFKGVGKCKGHKVKLHINLDVKPVA